MDLNPIFHPPTIDELRQRIERVQEAMRRQRLDWYVSFQPDNIYYLTNFANFVHERPFVLLIPRDGIPSFIVPKLEIPHICSRAIGTLDLIDYFEFPAPAGSGWADRMAVELGGAARVGVESVCPLHIYDEVRAERVRTDIIDELRFVKSPYEIGRMVYAGLIASAAMDDLLAKARVGRSQKEVAADCNALMFDRMVRDNPSINPSATRCMTVFQPPRYSDDPHNFTDLDMRMEDGGPHVTIINAVLNGYGSEIERTLFLGHVPEAARKPYDAMMRARELAFDLSKPGNRMCDVDKAVTDLLIGEGYGEALLHRAGHGMGVTAHEAPFLAVGDPRMIKPGMSFTIEPGIYLPGVGGFRHSDTILITETGHVRLTEAPDTLEALTL